MLDINHKKELLRGLWVGLRVQRFGLGFRALRVGFRVLG